jgi:hypothetical protein
MYMKKMFLAAALLVVAAPVFAEEANPETKGYFASAKDAVSGAVSSVVNAGSSAVDSVGKALYPYTPGADYLIKANDYVTSTLAAYPKTAVVVTAAVVAAVVNAANSDIEAEL